MLSVAIAIVVGWLVLAINKIDALEDSLQKSQLELQAIRQLESMRALETEKSLNRFQADFSNMDKRAKTIERRLNIGGVNGAGPAGNASEQNLPSTRRVIRSDGSLVIKTPLVE